MLFGVVSIAVFGSFCIGVFSGGCIFSYEYHNIFLVLSHWILDLLFYVDCMTGTSATYCQMVNGIIKSSSLCIDDFFLRFYLTSFAAFVSECFFACFARSGGGGSFLGCDFSRFVFNFVWFWRRVVFQSDHLLSASLTGGGACLFIFYVLCIVLFYCSFVCIVWFSFLFSFLFFCFLFCFLFRFRFRIFFWFWFWYVLFSFLFFSFRFRFPFVLVLVFGFGLIFVFVFFFVLLTPEYSQSRLVG